MVNHVRTLLLNESAAVPGLPEWVIDGFFISLKLKPYVKRLYDDVFGEGATVDEKVHAVDILMPFVMEPEFSSFISGIDGRMTVDDRPKVSTGSVFSFYKNINPGSSDMVSRVLSSTNSTMVFQHVGDADVDSKLDGLYLIRTGSKESSKAFSSCIVALVVLLDFEYRRTVADAK